jgi:RNA polymerase sigma-70 factor (sigma-E family)
MTEPGDAEFEAFVLAAWPRLRQAAYALTRDTENAEDLLQGVLVRLYTRWGRIVQDDPTAYVRRMLVNSYIDTTRRRRRVREVPVAEPADVPSADGTAVVADRDDLVGRLSVLSERERAMVVMRHYLDASEAEVARALGCSVGTVKSTCSRALGRLRIPTTATREDQR